MGPTHPTSANLSARRSARLLPVEASEQASQGCWDGFFGGGGGLPGNVQHAINDAQEKIARGVVRFDKTQSLSDAEEARVLANIGVFPHIAEAGEETNHQI